MKLSIKSIELNYEKKGFGKPLIMIHGNGEDLHIFDELAYTLKEDFTIYTIDMRNHGNSSKTHDFDYKTMADDLYLFAQKLEIEKPYFLGFSDGGIIGLLLSISYPNFFEKIVIAGANMNPQGFKINYLKEVEKQYKVTKSPLDQMMLEQPNITNIDLEKIKTSVLILAGENDMIRRTHTLRIARHIKSSILKIIPKRDHYSYIVHSDELSEVLKEFYLS